MLQESLFILLLIIAGCTLIVGTKTLVDKGIESAELIENDNLRFATLQLLDLASTIVASLNQTVVKPLKESPELNWDTKKQKEVLEQAKKLIKVNLDEKSFEILNKAYDRNLDEHIEHIVEAEVNKQK